MTDILDRIATRLDLRSYPNVTVRELIVGKAHTIVLLADIGSEAIAPPRVALQWAAQMGAGAIALIDDRYKVRIAIPIEQIESAPWSRLVAYASNLARELASRSRPHADVSGLEHLGG